jgi:hypothetical protein
MMNNNTFKPPAPITEADVLKAIKPAAKINAAALLVCNQIKSYEDLLTHFDVEYKVASPNVLSLFCNKCENEDSITLNLTSVTYPRWSCRCKAHQVYSDDILGLLMLKLDLNTKQISKLILQFGKSKGERGSKNAVAKVKNEHTDAVWRFL